MRTASLCYTKTWHATGPTWLCAACSPPQNPGTQRASFSLVDKEAHRPERRPSKMRSTSSPSSARSRYLARCSDLRARSGRNQRGRVCARMRARALAVGGAVSQPTPRCVPGRPELHSRSLTSSMAALLEKPRREAEKPAFPATEEDPEEDPEEAPKKPPKKPALCQNRFTTSRRCLATKQCSP